MWFQLQAQADLDDDDLELTELVRHLLELRACA